MNFNRKILKEICLEKTENLVEGKDYLYLDNGKKVLGVAHADTVFSDKELFFFSEKNYVFSPGLDDRLGVFILLELYRNQLDILITTDEEKINSTASLFFPKKKYNWIIEFDRKGEDIVTYQYQWGKNILKKYFPFVGTGSYSDIVDLEHLRVMAFNIGIGYYDNHKINSFADLRITAKSLQRFEKFLAENEDKKFKFNCEYRTEVFSWNRYFKEFYNL